MASRTTKTFLPRSRRAAGLPNLKAELLKGKQMGEMTYKVHLDGYNNMDHWTGQSEKSARRRFLLRRD